MPLDRTRGSPGSFLPQTFTEECTKTPVHLVVLVGGQLGEERVPASVAGEGAGAREDADAAGARVARRASMSAAS